jgi:hypothetical protein
MLGRMADESTGLEAPGPRTVAASGMTGLVITGDRARVDARAPVPGAGGIEFGEVRAAFDTAITSIESSADGRSAFHAATQLAELMAQLAERAAKLRAVMVVRVADEEKLSLAPLAERLSMSKARAAQLVRTGRAQGISPQEGDPQNG